MTRFECIGGPADGMMLEHTGNTTRVLFGHTYTLFGRRGKEQAFIHSSLTHLYTGKKK